MAVLPKRLPKWHKRDHRWGWGVGMGARIHSEKLVIMVMELVGKVKMHARVRIPKKLKW